MLPLIKSKKTKHLYNYEHYTVTTKRSIQMKMLKNLQKAALMVVLAAILLVPSALACGGSYCGGAYGTAYPYPYYIGYGQPRIGAYTSQFPVDQGMYDYISPPIGLTRYGADYNIYNIREPVYPDYGVARVPNLYQPYYGYPYGSYGSDSWMRYKYYALH